MQYRYERIVVGRNREGKSAVLNHARRVRGSEPCLMMGVSLDALPLK